MHIKTIHEGETLICSHCCKIFTEIGKLQKHIQLCRNIENLDKEKYFEKPDKMQARHEAKACDIPCNNDESVDAKKKKCREKI